MPDEDKELQAKELENLKSRAKTLGIKFHPATGAKKLAEKIQAHLDALESGKPEESVKAAPAAVAESKGKANNPVLQKALAKAAPETERQRHNRKRKEASRLIRIRVVCMNPNKKEWEGEMFTVSNSVVGTFKRFVQFNAEDGWHVEQIIYNAMKERKYQEWITKKGPRGNKVREGKLVNEFSIEILNPLTGEELGELAQRQAMANNIT